MTSEAIEAVVRCGGSQNSSLISTGEYLRKIQDFNQKLQREGLQLYDHDNPQHTHGTETADERPPVCLIAADVVSMFQNLERKEAAKLAREMIESSTVEFEGGRTDCRQMEGR